MNSDWRWAAVLMAAFSIGCETKVVQRRGLHLEDVPGAEGGLAAERQAEKQRQEASAWDSLLDQFPADEPKPGERGASESGSSRASTGATGSDGTDPGPLRRKAPDGTITLVLRSPSDVMYHVSQTLRNKEYDLLLEQVLSERLKTEYRKRMREPREAVDFLVGHEREIMALIAALPMGENTPGVLMEDIGPNAFRLRAPESMRPDLRLTCFDVVIEKGVFRLLMIE